MSFSKMSDYAAGIAEAMLLTTTCPDLPVGMHVQVEDPESAWLGGAEQLQPAVHGEFPVVVIQVEGMYRVAEWAAMFDELVCLSPGDNVHVAMSAELDRAHLLVWTIESRDTVEQAMGHGPLGVTTWLAPNELGGQRKAPKVADLVLEVREQEDKTATIGPVSLTPPVSGDYWAYRVRVADGQAIIGFPKFTTVGIGFAKETDWNTNLPYTCDTDEIYEHIKHNKGKGSISREACLQAIRMIQERATLDREASA